MEPTIYKPSIYKGAGIYKGAAGGGGGGGGGSLPEGYKESFFCEYYLNTSDSISHNELLINDNDYIEYCFSTPKLPDSNVGIDFLNASNTYFRSRLGDYYGKLSLYTQNNGGTVRNALLLNDENFVNLVIKKDSVVCNGVSTAFSKDPILKFSNSFSISSDSDLIGTKLFYIKVYDENENLKNHLVFCQDENGVQCVYDKIAQIKSGLNSSAYRLGPFL